MSQLYAFADPLSESQKQKVTFKFRDLLDEMKKPMLSAIRYAHTQVSPPVNKAEVWGNLFVPEKKELLDPDRYSPNKVPQDIYQDWDIQLILKYLYYGGTRITQFKPVKTYAKDQDRFFTLFGITYTYKPLKKKQDDPVGLFAGDYSRALYQAISLRNNTHHNTQSNTDEWTVASIAGYVEHLLVLLEPLCGAVAWDQAGIEAAKKLKREIWPSICKEMGEVSYSVARIVEFLRIPDAEQPQVEQMLIDAGFSVNNSKVAICGDVDELAYGLLYAWKVSTQIGREYALELLRACKQRLVDALASVREKSAQEQKDWESMPLDALEALASNNHVEAQYHLACRLLDEPRQKLFADRPIHLLRQSAKQGYAPAQVKLGQCYEKRIGVLRDCEEAFLWYKTAADQNAPDGQYNLGRCYCEEIGVDYNEELAIQHFYDAAQAGHREAKFELGVLYSGMRDKKKAFEIFTEMAGDGYAPAMRELALFYTYDSYLTDGSGNTFTINADIPHAMQLFRKAAVAGDVKAWLKLGEYYMREYRPKYDQALDAFVKAAELGDAEAQFQAAEIYYKGPAACRDSQKAFKWYQKAANQNHRMANVMLAECYADGIGVTENMRLASDYYCCDGSNLGKSIRALYERKERLQDPDAWDEDELDMEDAFKSLRKELKAYDRHLAMIYCSESKEKSAPILESINAPGRAVAMYELAECYEHGWGIKQEHALAFDLYTSAARLGLRKAMYALGRCYEEGIGVEVDLRKAFAEYKESAKQGNVAAMRAMYRCYEEGIGTEPDPLVAFGWLEAACDAGDTRSMRMLAQRYLLGTALSPTDEPKKPNQKKALAYLEQAIKAGDTAAETEFQNAVGEPYWRWKCHRDSLQQQHVSLGSVLASWNKPELLQEQEIDDLQTGER